MELPLYFQQYYSNSIQFKYAEVVLVVSAQLGRARKPLPEILNHSAYAFIIIIIIIIITIIIFIIVIIIIIIIIRINILFIIIIIVIWIDIQNQSLLVGLLTRQSSENYLVNFQFIVGLFHTGNKD